MPNSPEPTDNDQRLVLIRRLWSELQTTRNDDPKYKALTERIRRETDAFRAALDRDDPTKF